MGLPVVDASPTVNEKIVETAPIENGQSLKRCLAVLFY